MATKRDKDQPVRWKGDEVEDEPGDVAERAADRAEGNKPVRADEESRRLRDEELDQQAEPVEGERRARSASGDADGEIADAAEEHRARKDAGERPPRGKL